VCQGGRGSVAIVAMDCIAIRDVPKQLLFLFDADDYNYSDNKYDFI
jgi:hypothetical protein